jgi:hypothetical protein
VTRGNPYLAALATVLLVSSLTGQYGPAAADRRVRGRELRSAAARGVLVAGRGAGACPACLAVLSPPRAGVTSGGRALSQILEG